MRDRIGTGTPGPVSVTLTRTVPAASSKAVAMVNRRIPVHSAMACWAFMIRWSGSG